MHDNDDVDDGLSSEHRDQVLVAQKVCVGVYLTTSKLDELAAEITTTMTPNPPDYAPLAARNVASNLHKNRTNGTSNGLVPMFQVFNDTACYVDQGDARRRMLLMCTWSLAMTKFPRRSVEAVAILP
ncbi:hypothetical protein FNV43_RR10297 [Rhamnella rubrinervis]|uniref:Uncharacterized protein n=1 Tax=Rhamnella rubrinervis TaxID=2594499 RepID=A0A8K0HCD9_9ROSA|nr:hypothetical protein FNV43_RR10297 [Rhamnella rubrinervis]